MPCTALELPDSSEQKVRLVERDDPPLHVERVERPSIAGHCLQSFGTGQPLAARARWRRAFTPWMSASEFSQSEGATMCVLLAPRVYRNQDALQVATKAEHEVAERKEESG